MNGGVLGFPHHGRKAIQTACEHASAELVPKGFCKRCCPKSVWLSFLKRKRCSLKAFGGASGRTVVIDVFYPVWCRLCNQSIRILRRVTPPSLNEQDLGCASDRLKSWSTLVPFVGNRRVTKALVKAKWVVAFWIDATPSNGLPPRTALTHSRRYRSQCPPCWFARLIEACIIRYFAEIPTFTVEQCVLIDFTNFSKSHHHVFCWCSSQNGNHPLYSRQPTP